VIDAPEPPIDRILLTNVVMVSLALQTLAHMPTDTAENGVPLVAVNVTTPPDPEYEHVPATVTTAVSLVLVPALRFEPVVWQ
jgi:hypothetical protein